MTKAPVPLFRNRDYLLLWGGQVVSVVGSGASQIVYPLLILALTNSPAAAGFAAALYSIPYLVLSLPAGALIDRWDRKRVMIGCDIGRAITLASIPLALAFNALTLWQIYAAVLIEGTLFVFFNIAEVAAIPRVVPRDQLPEAMAQNDAAYSTANILAPSLGTFLYQALGRGFPFIFDSVSYVISVISLRFIRATFQSERTSSMSRGLPGIAADIREGLEWLWHRPLIRYMAFLTGGWNFVGAPMVLILIVLIKNLGANEADVGIIFSMGGVGGIVGALLGGRVQKRLSFGQGIVGAVWASALLFPLFLIAPNIYVMGVILGLSFCASAIYNVVLLSYRLALIPDALQGRVNSTFRLLAFGFQPAGAALGGVLLERTGGTPTMIIYSICLFGLALLTLFNADVRHAKPLEQVQAV